MRQYEQFYIIRKCNCSFPDVFMQPNGREARLDADDNVLMRAVCVSC